MSVQNEVKSLEEKRKTLKKADSSKKETAKKNVATSQEALTKAWLRRACAISMIVIALVALAVVLWVTVFTKGIAFQSRAIPKHAVVRGPRHGLAWSGPPVSLPVSSYF